LNGVKITRSQQDATGAQTEASAKLEDNWLFGAGKILTIDLDPDNGESVELQVMLRDLKPGTYTIAPQPRPDSATAMVNYSGNGSYNLAMGAINIFAIDTVANTVSGSFSFNATAHNNTYDTMRVLAGSFSNVPIYIGSFEQGYVTALAENEYFASTTSDFGATAFIYNQSNGLHIQAHAMDQNGNERVITLYVENPRVATFNLKPSGYPQDGTSYQSSTISLSSGTGSLAVTKFDTVTHRLSGTFNFTVQDYYYGTTVRIANGVLDNLQWFVL
jgi:hypothetical protein